MILGLTARAWAYDCGGVDRTTAFGTHRKINEMAIKSWLAGTGSDEARKKYLASLETAKSPLLTGVAVREAGLEIIREGPENGTFDWWIVEGGFTADEPELYNSFRHFYDPVQADGVPYLTDHLKELDYVYRTAIFAVTRSPFAAFTSSVNPRVDARDWAVNGTQNNGIRPNEYSWKEGALAMAQGFADKTSNKNKLFAKSWRALGETMHLIADMTCVPHVRNDSHPGRAIYDYIGLGNADANLGLLRNDPYELLCIPRVAEAAGAGALVSNMKPFIANATDPMDLFDKVARFTNRRFFSADTISGSFRGQDFHNANGRPDYEAPKLENLNFDEDSGYFYGDFDGVKVSLAHRTWLGEQGWGEPMNRIAISYESVREQAGILIPIAIAANVRLIDWYVPRVEIKLDAFDRDKKILTGLVKHTPYGAQTKELFYSGGPDDKYELAINGNVQPQSAYTLKVENGKISVDLSAMDPRTLSNALNFTLRMSIGGVMVHSEEMGTVKIYPDNYELGGVDVEYAFAGTADPPPAGVKKLSYLWTFGDGTRTIDYPYDKPLDKPLQIQMKHKFPKEGIFTVGLEVADVTSGLWRKLYEGKTTMTVLRPIGDKEAIERALSFARSQKVFKNPGVTADEIQFSSIERTQREFSNVAPKAMHPSSATVYLRVSGTRTGSSEKWSGIVSVWVSITKYGGPVEAGEILPASSLSDY